jgi:hypothetical protein
MMIYFTILTLLFATGVNASGKCPIWQCGNVKGDFSKDNPGCVQAKTGFLQGGAKVKNACNKDQYCDFMMWVFPNQDPE